jgi:threonine synthase
MKYFSAYRCSLCGQEYEPDDLYYVCPRDGGNLDVVLDYKSINRKFNVEDIVSLTDGSLWRYLPLLPVSDPGGYGTPLRAAGWTPIFSPPSMMKKWGLKNFWIKDEGRNPTASFKDRASAVVLARAREINADVIVTASTGNAGAALAGMAAASGQHAVIFAPRTAPQAKVAQLLIYGAQVILVDGSYDQAFDLTVAAAKEFGWYCRNTGYNPFTVEGKKTAAFEIWEKVLLDLDQSIQPLNVVVSVGDGNIISGIHKGFKDLQSLGWLEIMPRIFGIQSTGSAAIANAFFAHSEKIIPVSANTIADSISVDLPRDGVRAVRAAVQTGGSFVTVEDSQIVAAIGELGKAGIFAEPAGATAYAGFIKCLKEGLIQGDQPTLLVNTGSGLKDIRTAMQAVKEAPVIEPSMGALKKHLGL